MESHHAPHFGEGVSLSFNRGSPSILRYYARKKQIGFSSKEKSMLSGMDIIGWVWSWMGSSLSMSLILNSLVLLVDCLQIE